MKTLISVVIPTFNRPDYLIQMLESIFAQKFHDYEIIIVDDSIESPFGDSAEGARMLSQCFERIVYFQNDSNRGPGYCRKFGFEKAKGKYVIFADDDDFYIDPDFFTNAVRILETDSSLAFVSGGVNYLETSTGQFQQAALPLVGKIEKKRYLKDFHYRISKPTSTFSSVFVKQKLLSAGLLQMVMVNDASIYLRALLVGDAFFLENIIGNYRVHESNISKALDFQFLVDNMNEKLEVLKLAEHEGLIDNARVWRFEQIIMNLIYYVRNHEGSFSDYLKIFIWNLKNSSFRVRGSLILLKEFLFKIFNLRVT